MTSSNIRVLIYGHINVNVLDGSSFFLAALSSMLGSDPGIEVDLVLANPLRKHDVVSELEPYHNVRVLDPFEHGLRVIGLDESLRGSGMTEVEAGQLLGRAWRTGNYDAVLVRSTVTALALSRSEPSVRPHLLAYVTGFVDSSGASEQLSADLLELCRHRVLLCCQTDDMRAELSAFLRKRGEEPRVTTLYPMVPDTPARALTADPGRLRATRFVYTGKFFPDWNPVQMIAGFREAHLVDSSLRLAVAGNHFRPDPENRTFVPEVKYLLRNSAGVRWYGGLDRASARAVILAADVGISWRSGRLSNSLELSTKLLEYGALGKPCILNPTEMHRNLLGDDYPLFAESMDDFVAAILRVSNDHDAYSEAARRASNLAGNYTYTAAAKRFTPTLFQLVGDRAEPYAIPGHGSQNGEPGVYSQADGSIVIDLREIASNDLLRLAHATGSLPRRLGPFLRLDPRVQREESDNGMPLMSSHLFDLVVERAAHARTTIQPPPSLPDDRADSSDATPAGPKKDATVLELEDRVKVLEAERSGLRKRLIHVEKQRDVHAGRLEALRRSRLGSMQVRIWRARKRLMR